MFVCRSRAVVIFQRGLAGIRPAFDAGVGGPVGSGTVAVPRRESTTSREELSVNRIVLHPARRDRAGKRQDIFIIEQVVIRRRSAKPIRAVFDGSLGIAADETRRLSLRSIAANMLQPPSK